MSTDPLAQTGTTSPEGPTPKERMVAVMGYLPGGAFIVKGMGESITDFTRPHMSQGLILWGVTLILMIIGSFILGFILGAILIAVPAYLAFQGKTFLYPGVAEISKKLPF